MRVSEKKPLLGAISAVESWLWSCSEMAFFVNLDLFTMARTNSNKDKDDGCRNDDVMFADERCGVVYLRDKKGHEEHKKMTGETYSPDEDKVSI